MIKKLTSLILAVVLIGSVVACGKDSTADGKTKKTIEFWTMDLKVGYKDYFEEIISRYEETHPNVKVKWVDLPSSDIQSKLMTAIAGGEAPDVVNLNVEMTLNLASKKGTLVDLNKEASDEQKEIYLPNLWDATTIEDAAYSFPWYVSPTICVYNKELLKEGGIETPPKNYEEALLLCDDFYDKTGAYLFQPNLLHFQMIEDELPLLDESRSKAAFNTSEHRALLKKYKEHTDRGTLPKDNWGEWINAMKLFGSGKLAILNTSGASIVRIKDEAPDIYETIDVTQAMVGKGGFSRNGLMNLVVPNISKNHELAIDFANYVTNDENQLAFCKIVSIFPSTKKAAEDPFFTADMDTVEGRASALCAESSASGKEYSVPCAKPAAVRKEISKIYEAVILNNEDLEESFDLAEKTVNTLLAE